MTGPAIPDTWLLIDTSLDPFFISLDTSVLLTLRPPSQDYFSLWEARVVSESEAQRYKSRVQIDQPLRRFRREGSVASEGSGCAGGVTSTPANYGIPSSYSTNFHLPMPEGKVGSLL